MTECRPGKPFGERLLRLSLTAGGLVALFIGTFGFLIPFVPTTVFIVLAAYCFTHGHEALAAWIRRQWILGRVLSAYKAYGVPRKLKIVFVGGSTGYSSGIAWYTLSTLEEYVFAGIAWFLTVLTICLLPDRTKKPRGA
jgi:uncharacterized protein